MDYSKIRIEPVAEPITKPDFDAQFSDLVDDEETPANTYNPVLDDDDEPTYVPQVIEQAAVVSAGFTQPVEATSTASPPWHRERTEEEEASLEARAEAGELLPGHKHRDPYSFGWLTTIDLFHLWFIGHSRWTTDTIIQTARGLKSNISTYTRLRRLETAELVRAQHRVGMGQVWTLTKLGMRTLQANGWDRKLRREGFSDPFPYVGQNGISVDNPLHTLAVGLATAQLLRGGFYDLGFGQEGYSPITRDQLVSEWTVRTHYQRVTGDVEKEVDREERWAKAVELRKFYRDGVKEKRWTWEEAFATSPALWVPAHHSQEFLAAGKSAVSIGGSHTPDLVVSRLAQHNDLMVNTAIEVELTDKKQGDYDRILTAYAKAGRMYHRVVWLVGSEAVGKVIQKSLSKMGPDAGQHVILPLNLGEVLVLMTAEEAEAARARRAKRPNKKRAHRQTKRALPKTKLSEARPSTAG